MGNLWFGQENISKKNINITIRDEKILVFIKIY